MGGAAESRRRRGGSGGGVPHAGAAHSTIISGLLGLNQQEGSSASPQYSRSCGVSGGAGGAGGAGGEGAAPPRHSNLKARPRSAGASGLPAPGSGDRSGEIAGMLRHKATTLS